MVSGFTKHAVGLPILRRITEFTGIYFYTFMGVFKQLFVVINFYHRGESFRRVLGRIGEVSSLLPP